VILAAGQSQRMGSPKALLLTRDGRTFVTAIRDSLAAAGCADDLMVVTGTHHDAVAAAIREAAWTPPPHIVRNPDPSRGQLSSLWTAMDALAGPDTAALLVTLVDVPNIQPATIRAVVDAWTRTRAPIVRPAIGDRHGHPVIFDRTVFRELREAPLERGAKAVFEAHAGEVVNVTVDDPGCLVDVDTPDDYARLVAGTTDR
jgi:molybdenum cofactor cytidylyltransferase